jgi:hypothetical protein
MTRPVDLMPAACREVLNRRAEARRWTLVYALTATTLFAAFWYLSAANRARERRRDIMAAQVQINWKRSEIVNRLVGEINAVEAAISRYDRLAWPVRATQVVAAVGAALPSDATLTQAALTSREEKIKPPPRAPADGPAPTPAPRTFMIVELEGIARNDAAVASFVSAIDDNPLFSRVDLEFTRAVEAASRSVRGFRLVAQVDLSARFEFAEVSP